MVNWYLAGIAPRSTTYMQTHWDHAKGFIQDADLEAAREEESQRWLQAQSALSFQSPAYTNTEDLLRPITQLEGARIGPLTRTFETNTFHRQCIVEQPLDPEGLRPWVDSIACEDPWILTLPSPYDLFVRGEISPDAQESVVELLRDAAKYGLSKGAYRVVFWEPSALYHRHPVDGQLLRELTQAVCRGIENRCITWFEGTPAGREGILRHWPIRGIALAPSDTPVDLQDCELTVCALRGSETLADEHAEDRASAYAEACNASLWGISNDVAFEHLPFDLAVQKLASIRKEVLA